MLTTTFENEKETCNDIYEVLWHSIVFRSLIECVFPELICEFSLENPKKREDRENFLSKTKNTQKNEKTSDSSQKIIMKFNLI